MEVQKRLHEQLEVCVCEVYIFSISYRCYLKEEISKRKRKKRLFAKCALNCTVRCFFPVLWLSRCSLNLSLGYWYEVRVWVHIQCQHNMFNISDTGQLSKNWTRVGRQGIHRTYACQGRPLACSYNVTIIRFTCLLILFEIMISSMFVNIYFILHTFRFSFPLFLPFSFFIYENVV